VKLTHRDFRPLRRSKYVAQPLKRRPTLRILLLAALGIIVYLKYDTVVRSKAFKSLSEPAKLWHALLHEDGALPLPVVSGAGLKWSPDSAFLDAECDGSAAGCLESWKSLGREPVGTLRAVMEKARIQWNAGAENGFSAKYARIAHAGEPADGMPPDLELIRVELRGARGAVTLERSDAERSSAFCMGGEGDDGGEGGKRGKDSKDHKGGNGGEGDKCLDERRTQLPFARTRIGIPSPGPDSGGVDGSGAPGMGDEEAMGGEHGRVMRIFSLAGPAAKPVLAGRVVAVPDSLIDNPWVKIYHGENTFSWYRGFSSLRSGIVPGALIGTDDTLGFVAMRGDTTEALDVRIEQDGIPADPFGFLGIARAENGF
jgi:hypothetical protein